MLALLISPERPPSMSWSSLLCAALSSPVSVSPTRGSRLSAQARAGAAAGQPSSGLGFRFWFFFSYFH
jgi:hypothetical protein